MAVTLDSFMRALSGQESGGSPTAQNSRTGAYGTFQIMPSNWPSWAQEAGLPADAPQTPENQTRVAKAKIQQYYNKFGNWGDVASAWYSGQPLSAYDANALNRKQGNGDEPSIAEYTNSVLARAGGDAVTTPTSTAKPGATYKAPTYNPDTDPQAIKLKSLVDAAIAAAAKNPSDPAAALNVKSALTNWANYRESLLTPGDPSKTAAQQAFDNTIALGDLGVKQASAAYQNWANKANYANQAAKTQIQDTENRQKAIGDMTEARNNSSTPGLMPRSVVAGYNPAPTSDIIGMYLDKANKASPDVTAGTDTAAPAGVAGGGAISSGIGDIGSGLQAGGAQATTDASTPDWGQNDVYKGGVDQWGNPKVPYSTSKGGFVIDPYVNSGTPASKPSDPSHGHNWWQEFGGNAITGAASSMLPGLLGNGVSSALGSGASKYADFIKNRFFKDGTASAPGGPVVVGDGSAKQTAMQGANWWKRIQAPHYATGTMNHPGGPATVGESGTETAIYPGGGMQPVGVYGPEVTNLPQGTKVIPAGVPPEQAAIWSQIQDAAKQGGTDMLTQQRDAEARANDPMLAEKVRASLQKALAGLDAMAPPTAPMPYGGATDKFADWRPLHAQIQAQAAQLAPVGKK